QPGSTARRDAVRLSANTGGAIAAGTVAARGDIEVDAPFLPGQALVQFDRPERAAELVRELFGNRARIAPDSAAPDSHAIVQFDLDATSISAARQETLQAISTLLASDDVSYAEPNYILQLRR
ncbi:MAG: hypothetical protein AAFX40_16265, partial [Cyanobacteria bacterium J06639_1]